MDLKTDFELIQLHREGSQEAFAELVRRHINWIHSIARRRVRNEHLAEDITQATFAVLARKPPKLTPKHPLSAWLFHVVTLASKTAMRADSRRKHHETEAAKMRNRHGESEIDTWERLAPDLDDMVGHLHGADRKAVLLRFYEQKNFAEIGAALGITELAARKRVNRATEKLREQFANTGRELLTTELTTALLTNLVIPAHSKVMRPFSRDAASLPASTDAAVLAKKVIAVMQLRYFLTAVAAIILPASLAIGIGMTIKSADKPAMAAPATRPSQGFPPRIEKELTVPEDVVLDLDSGSMLSLPADVKWFDHEKRLAWTNATGGDCWVHTIGNPHDLLNAASDLGGLFGADMAVVEVDNSLWEQSGFIDIAAKLLGKHTLVDQSIRPMNRFPRTYLFKTRQGSVGILQFLRFEKSPRAAVVRFKAWQADPPR